MTTEDCSTNDVIAERSNDVNGIGLQSLKPQESRDVSHHDSIATGCTIFTFSGTDHFGGNAITMT